MPNSPFRHQPFEIPPPLALVLALAVALLGPPSDARAALTPAPPLTPPLTGRIRVAFLVSPGSNVIDMTGPWEVFQDVQIPGRVPTGPFELYTVAATKAPVRLTGGLQVVPDYSIDDAPLPDVVVVPAMRGSDAVHAWLRKVAPEADQIVSVCTGAFQLAQAGLLDGLPATTHHDFWDELGRDFPKVKLVKGERWVESSAKISTAGGLTSGIDLALRVVERYFGPETASATAAYMEYRMENRMEDRNPPRP